MELEVVKILSALVLWILSLCFGLMVPYLIWKSRGCRRHQSCSNAHALTENDVLIDNGENTEIPDDVKGRWGRFKTSAKASFAKLRRYDVISVINCFCGGLFLGICLLELLPESRAGVTKALTSYGIVTSFPVTEFMIGAGLLLVMFIDHAVSDVCARRNTSQSNDYDVMNEQRTRDDEVNAGGDVTHSRRSSAASLRHVDVTSSESIRTLMLIGMLSIHSIFEGLALGLEVNVSALIQLLLAVSVHKGVLAFGLGLRLFEAFAHKLSTALACAIIFCSASPLGCVVGIFLTPTSPQPNVTTPTPYFPGYADVALASVPATVPVSAVLECLATGTFLYVTFIEVIPSEFSHNDGVDMTSCHPRKKQIRKLFKLLILLLGFGAIVGLQFI
uniref:zinc transporter ZIP1 n=1 Tax=Ciona intestinalis TaxID=7719 RepID=UPI000180C619|nr:zinc transporter ZIP1 [Ciona intestinalis]|eukprot:XP_002123868.3 zinc transporter ZIP1 [Ciona intestinalis]